jgi:hypothetical protein
MLGSGVVFQDPAEQADQLLALGWRKRGEQLVLDAGQELLQPPQVGGAGRGDADDVAAPAGGVGGAAGEPPAVTATGAAIQLHSRISADTAEITRQLWGDLPAGDLATAGRVLAIITERANAQLARQH